MARLLSGQGQQTIYQSVVTRRLIRFIDPIEYNRCTRVTTIDFVDTEAIGLVTDRIVLRHISQWQQAWGCPSGSQIMPVKVAARQALRASL
jgi:hypothetical protein